MQIAIPLYDGVTALDVVGPYDLLARVPGVEVHLVGPEARAYADEHGVLTFTATKTLAEMPQPDVIVLPGGPPDAVVPAIQGPITPWLAAAHPKTQWTASVCTGAFFLGAAGLLGGRKATTHWAGQGVLKNFGATYVPERVLFHEDIHVIMSGGISAGMDMTLSLIERISDSHRARCTQLAVEYDPAPPFDVGHPSKAPKEVFEQMVVELKAVL